MRALIKFAKGPEGVALREVPPPVPKEGELRVKVLAAGICGSDIHAMNDERVTVMPVILGHEFVGEVVEARGDTGDFRPGDWVTALPACYSCGTCELCQRGLVTLCRKRRSIGFHINGAMAEEVVIPARYAYRLPAGARTREDRIACSLTEPMACVVRGVYEKIEVHPGDTVVVSGPGVMGQLAAQVFKSRGAFVIVSGLPQDKEKLALAKALGADAIADSPAALRELVYARSPSGADITCEATGLVPSLNTCVEVIRPLGTHLQLGMFGGTMPVRLDNLFEKEIAYIPSNSTAATTWPIALRLLEEGKVTLRPFVSMTRPLSEWRRAFDAAIRKEVYKAVLLPENDFNC